ncbi:hypothetical protein AB1Y20_008836 [Prymnesium parvum]|uniref:SET domain-containing protein n=1 Tax=Prymnesium parvum TaxID=97485 RepID=A0AB34IUF4_PRYPA
MLPVLRATCVIDPGTEILYNYGSEESKKLQAVVNVQHLKARGNLLNACWTAFVSARAESTASGHRFLEEGDGGRGAAEPERVRDDCGRTHLGHQGGEVFHDELTTVNSFMSGKSMSSVHKIIEHRVNDLENAVQQLQKKVEEHDKRLNKLEESVRELNLQKPEGGLDHFARLLVLLLVPSHPLRRRRALALMLHGVEQAFLAATHGQPLHTAAEWRDFLAAVDAAGLLPQAELIRAASLLPLPFAFDQLAEQLASDHEPAADVAPLLSDALCRARHLHSLLAEWQLPQLSDAQTRRLLRLAGALHARLASRAAALRQWQRALDARLGDEGAQTLFWDRIAAAATPPTPHAFQREQLARVEARCAQRRLARAGGARVLALGRGAAWEEEARLLQLVDATRQLSLSAHAAAFLGEAAGEGGATRWLLAPREGPCVRRLVEARGGVKESARLFAQWRQQLAHALLHVSAQTTFLLRAAVGLEHAHVTDGGRRIVLHDLPWGAEFPEVAFVPSDSEPEAQPLDLALCRDRLLVADLLAMLSHLLGADGSASPPRLSAELAAIHSACAHRPPTMLQLTSHPYFAPVPSERQIDVEHEFIRYTEGWNDE